MAYTSRGFVNDNTGRTTMPMGFGTVSGEGGTGAKKKLPGGTFAATPGNMASVVGLPQATVGTPQGNSVSGNMGPGGAGTGRTAYTPAANAARTAGTMGPGGAGSTPTGMSIASVPQATVNGGTGGSGTNAATSLPQNGTDLANWQFQNGGTSWSNRDLETLANDPMAFQKAFLASLGMDTPGANAALGRYAQRLNPLAFALMGANRSPEAQGDIEDILGMYEALMSNYMTPGARMPDAAEIARIVMNSGSIASGADPANLLQAVLSGQDPQGQTEAVNAILGAALAGMPGMFGQGWANLLDNQSSNYLQGTMDAYGGPNNTFVDYLRNDPFMRQFAGI